MEHLETVGGEVAFLEDLPVAMKFLNLERKHRRRKPAAVGCNNPDDYAVLFIVSFKRRLELQIDFFADFFLRKLIHK